MSGWFIFDDFDTRTLDVDVYPEQIDTAPARDFKVIDVQGRNGSIIVDQERYPNVERSYWILAESGFSEVYNAISNALLHKRGYCRLTDSWNPDEYYMAYVNTPLQPEISWKTGMGKLLVTFTRKPQRWLVGGDTPISLRSQSRFENKTPCKMYPLFKFVVNKDYTYPNHHYAQIEFHSGYSGYTWIAFDYGTVEELNRIHAESEAIFVDCASGIAYTDTGEDITWAIVDDANEYILPNTTAVITVVGSDGPSFLFLDTFIQLQQFTI